MPLAKGRSSRRSGTSTPVVTTVAFVALCVLGVWLLASTPVAPPKSTTKTAASSTVINLPRATSDGATKSTTPFEDLHGDLPEEARNGNGGSGGGSSEISNDSQSGEAQAATTEDPAKETVDQESGSVKNQESSSEGEGQLPGKEEQEKQKEPETQVSEESTITQQKEIETIKQNVELAGSKDDVSAAAEKREESSDNQKGGNEDIHKGGNEETKVQDSQIKSQQTSEENKNLISDEDQQKRLEHHQQQEDDQIQQKQPQNEIIETTTDPNKAWLTTQADQSVNHKERKEGADDQQITIKGQQWQLCNVTAGADYIPCLDNEKALAKIRGRQHYEHRERHCPTDPPIWYPNVPHTLLAEFKGHQNWVKVSGEFITFPGGGTQFIHGALHYIDFIQQAVPDIAWGKHTRVVLDVGCGVASFGGYIFERDVITMSFAPKDEHEAQVQFALERGIPAISAVMGTQRLPFPNGVFDAVHCARCRVPWHIEGGKLLLELNRVLRPGGHFIWSATPVYQKLEEDVQIWRAKLIDICRSVTSFFPEMTALTVSMCWELIAIKKDKLNSIGAAIYRKPDTNDCYKQRKRSKPPMCKKEDDPNAAWYVPLEPCMHRVPSDEKERGSKWPEEWPARLHTPPYWLNRDKKGIYGRPAPDDFESDYKHWKNVVRKTYLSGLGIRWYDVRNIMDMRAVYGGFAAALKDLKVWVMNVVNVDSPDTLPIIYERGLFGMYHDWCESFSTYPRTYDLLHADHLFSRLKKRCDIKGVLVEVDRIVRPGGSDDLHSEPRWDAQCPEDVLAAGNLRSNHLIARRQPVVQPFFIASRKLTKPPPDCKETACCTAFLHSLHHLIGHIYQIKIASIGSAEYFDSFIDCSILKTLY
nr:probable methyltransferase PMT27 [Ipomoea trifida]